MYAIRSYYVIDNLVREAYQRKMQDGMTESVKSKMIFEQLDKLRRIENSTNKMIFVLLEFAKAK